MAKNGRAERPEPMSDDEWSSAKMSVDERSEDDENSQAATVTLESPPTDDLGRIWRIKAKTHSRLRLSRGLSIASVCSRAVCRVCILSVP